MEILIRDTLNYWSNYLTKAKIIIEGTEYTYPFLKKTIDLNKGNIRFIIHIPGNKGKVTDVTLINNRNEEVRTLKSNLEKGVDGLVIVISWSLIVEEVSNL